MVSFTNFLPSINNKTGGDFRSPNKGKIIKWVPYRGVPEPASANH
jgi:hypothetical protein